MSQQDLITGLRRSALLYLVLGVLLIAVGVKFKLSFCFFPLAIGALAYFFLTRAFRRLRAASNLDHEQMREFQRAFQQQFARHNLPRQVFWLLFAVAEADGKTEAEERELVRRFLLERFTDPATAQDLREWEATRVPPEQVGSLALHIARVLTPSERETVFCWCCLVAFADRKYGPDEHRALHEIARAFGFPPHHARRIFHYAKSMHLTGAGERRQQHHTGGGYRDGRRAQGAVSDRREALLVLGLDDAATKEDIRRRHRELVREFHPDRHQHLGEVAAKEAEERFRRVQAAYEVLAG